MPFVDPVYFATVPWATREDPLDDESPLVEIRPGELDATTTAQRRVAWYQLASATTWPVLATEIGTGHQIQERALGSVDQARYLSTAEGVALDELGALVGLPRNGLEDKLYRAAIRVEAGTLWSSGTLPEIVSLARGLFGATTRVRPYYPAVVHVQAREVDAEIYTVMLSILGDVPAAGVALILSEYVSGGVGGWGSTTDPGGTETPGHGTWSSTTGTDADAGPGFWASGQPVP